MGNAVEKLQEPDLVTRFQRLCGLLPGRVDTCPRTVRAGVRGSGPLPGCIGGCGALRGANGCSCTNCAASQDLRSEVPPYIVNNRIVHFIFIFSAAFGREGCIITFLPFCYWNVEPLVGRRVVAMWAVVMYLGQVLKDKIRWPRPPSPPVLRLETRVEAEYGMPSTHAMAATAIPFAFLLTTMDRYHYPLEFGVMVALLLCVLVSLSRLYTGMHSVLDVICGVVLTAVLLAISFPFWDTMDSLIIHSNLTPALALCGPFLLCIHYPEMNPWSTTRGDTTIIMGAWAGSTIASWLCYQFSLTQDVPKENLPFELPSITLGLIRNMMSRYLVGVSLVVITRQLSKTLVLSIVCQVMGVSPTDTEARKDLWVEVPYKFATYSIVGVSGFFGGPLLFHYIGLD
uniref:Sphingosine-1-phosphate phosphatase 2 n=1 Tax=Eptatretus burgeri TaxID=7764 RepID=A0A8C4X2C8_EPTBU